MMEEFNPRGIELLLEVIREQVAPLPCPGCGQPFGDAQIELQEMTIDRVGLEMVCGSCAARHRVTVSPASEGGIPVVR